MSDGQTIELRKMPLEGKYEEKAAEFTALFGWKVPAHFGDPEAEYNAARQSVALFDASFLTVVSAKGADHLEYLNRRLSQRVIALGRGEGARANQLSGDGRMEADLELLRLDEERSVMIAPPAAGGEYLQQVADKYVFSEDAQFADESGDWVLLALLGPKLNDVMATLGLRAPARAGEVASSDGGVYAFSSSFLPDGLLLLLKKDSSETFYTSLLQAVSGNGGCALGFLAFDTLRVESGIPWWGIDLTEKSIPLEADLMNAIHTNKGCYPGQETIAKIMNLGHPARKLVGLLIDTEDPVPAYTPLKVDGKEVGVLTSSTYSPRLNRAIGLAMVKWNHRAADTVFQLGDGLTAKAVNLPFA